MIWHNAHAVYKKHIPLMIEIAKGKTKFLKEVVKSKYIEASDIILVTSFFIIGLIKDIISFDTMDSFLISVAISLLGYFLLYRVVTVVYQWGLLVMGYIYTKGKDYDQMGFYNAHVHTFIPHLIQIALLYLLVWTKMPLLVPVVIIAHIWWKTLDYRIIRDVLKVDKTWALIVVGSQIVLWSILYLAVV